MKNKKTVGMALALAVVGAAFAPTANVFKTRADETDLANEYFIQFMVEDGNAENELAFTYTPLYDETLEVNGRQYDFTVGDKTGYALMTEIEYSDSTFYEIEELFYNKTSPFDDCEGTPVYIAHQTYLEYKDNAFFHLKDSTQVSDEQLESYVAKGFGYCGTSDFVEQTETITYSRKETSTYTIPFDLPNYWGSVDGITGCANTAGAVLIGYYDRFYENLIPNYQSYIQIGSVIRYKTTPDEVANLTTELYTLMGTDVNQLGTTYTGFQNGMNQYVTGKGFTYTTTSVFSSGAFNFASYKTSVENGKPVAIFLNTYAMLNGITETTGQDTIKSGYTTYSHVCVGCGYKRDTYYNASEQVIDTRTYLKVASGLASYEIGYLNINGLGNIDHAISVTIN